jgi:hypothetical protein
MVWATPAPAIAAARAIPAASFVFILFQVYADRLRPSGSSPRNAPGLEPFQTDFCRAFLELD